MGTVYYRPLWGTPLPSPSSLVSLPRELTAAPNLLSPSPSPRALSLAYGPFSFPHCTSSSALSWDVETMPEILLAFSHGFGEMWHSDMISAFLPPFHANARIFPIRHFTEILYFIPM